MKTLLLPLLVLTCVIGCSQAKAQPYLVYSSYDKYISGTCDTINAMRFNKRSAMSMIMWGGGSYNIDSKKIEADVASFIDTTEIFIIAHGDTLYLNCTQLKKGSRPGYAKAIEINGKLYLEANLRGDSIPSDPTMFATSQAGGDGIIGTAVNKPQDITKFFILDAKTMTANKLQTEDFLGMLKSVSPDAYDEYIKKAMGQKDIEGLYPQTVWPYMFMLKENSTKLKTKQ